MKFGAFKISFECENPFRKLKQEGNVASFPNFTILLLFEEFVCSCLPL